MAHRVSRIILTVPWPLPACTVTGKFTNAGLIFNSNYEATAGVQTPFAQSVDYVTSNQQDLSATVITLLRVTLLCFHQLRTFLRYLGVRVTAWRLPQLPPPQPLCAVRTDDDNNDGVISWFQYHDEQLHQCSQQRWEYRTDVSGCHLVHTGAYGRDGIGHNRTGSSTPGGEAPTDSSPTGHSPIPVLSVWHRPRPRPGP